MNQVYLGYQVQLQKAAITLGPINLFSFGSLFKDDIQMLIFRSRLQTQLFLRSWQDRKTTYVSDIYGKMGNLVLAFDKAMLQRAISFLVYVSGTVIGSAHYIISLLRRGEFI